MSGNRNITYRGRTGAGRLVLWAWLLVSWALVFAVQAQPGGKPRYTPNSQLPVARAEIDPANPVMGEPITLIVEVPYKVPELDQPKLEAPGVELKLIDRLGSRVEIVNGRISQWTQLYYQVEVPGEGSYSIPEQVLDVGSRQFRIEELQFQVTKGRTRYWADLELDETELYVGEMTRAVLNVYFDASVRVVDFTRELNEEFEGFTVGDWKVRGQGRRTLPDGRQVLQFSYEVAVAPVKSGAFELSPLESDWIIELPSDRGRSPFPQGLFGGSNLGSMFADRIRVTVVTEPVEVEVKSLPEPDREIVKETFRGAVGKFGMHVTLNPGSVQVGEPVSFTMRVGGSGNFSRVNEPVVRVDEQDWQTYDAESQFEPIDKQSVGIDGVKIFRQLMVPRRQEVEMPRFLFSYFDPAEEKYVLLEKGDDLELEVRDGGTQYLVPEPEEEPAQEVASEEPEEPGKELVEESGIRTILEPETLEVRSLRPLYREPLFWVVQSLPPAALLAFVIAGLMRARHERLTPARKRAGLENRQREILRKIRDKSCSRAELYPLAAEHLGLSARLSEDELDGGVEDRTILRLCPREEGAAAGSQGSLRRAVSDILRRKDAIVYGGAGGESCSVPTAEKERVLEILESYQESLTGKERQR